MNDKDERRRGAPRRVYRGGSWNYHTSTLKVNARAFDFAVRGNNHFGFRIVMSP